jgi:hypothetical protein
MCMSTWRGAPTGSCKLLPKRQSACSPSRRLKTCHGRRGQVLLGGAGAFCAQSRALRAAQRMTGRPCHLMPRGVDAELFHPVKRKRDPADRDHSCWASWAGFHREERALLSRCRKELEAMGHKSFRFLIVGHGGERPGCANDCRAQSLPACCKGEELARGLRQHGPVRLPLAHRHVWQRGAGGAGQRRAGDCDSRRRPQDDCPRRRDRADRRGRRLCHGGGRRAGRSGRRMPGGAELCADDELGLLLTVPAFEGTVYRINGLRQ